MYMHETSTQAYVRVGPVGLALAVDWQRQESVLGEAMARAHPSEGIPPTFTLPFHSFYFSSPVVNYGGWSDGGNPGLGLGVAGACAVSVVTEGDVPFSPPPYSPASAFGGRLGFPAPLLPSGGH